MEKKRCLVPFFSFLLAFSSINIMRPASPPLGQEDASTDFMPLLSRRRLLVLDARRRGLLVCVVCRE